MDRGCPGKHRHNKESRCRRNSLDPGTLKNVFPFRTTLRKIKPSLAKLTGHNALSFFHLRYGSGGKGHSAGFTGSLHQTGHNNTVTMRTLETGIGFEKILRKSLFDFHFFPVQSSQLFFSCPVFSFFFAFQEFERFSLANTFGFDFGKPFFQQVLGFKILDHLVFQTILFIPSKFHLRQVGLNVPGMLQVLLPFFPFRQQPLCILKLEVYLSPPGLEIRHFLHGFLCPGFEIRNLCHSGLDLFGRILYIGHKAKHFYIHRL